MADLGSILKGAAGSNTLNQIVLYQVVGQLIQGALEPYFRALGYKVNELTPNAALTPAELAALVERTFLDEPIGAAEAAKYGIDAGRFHQLVQLAEQAPPPEFLAVALRRGIIPEDDGNAEGTSFHAGIAQGAIATKWEPVIRAMATSIPSPEMALEALLEGQTDDANARALYEAWGGDPQYFDLMYDTRGQAPTPTQALELLNRGIIPERGTGPDSISYEQAFLEGPWRNKWLAPFLELGKYVPPPRTVTAMVRDGSLTDEQALGYFRAYGMTPELAASFLASAHHERTSSVHEIARSTLQELYRDQIITRDELTASLGEMGWSAEDSEYLAQIVDVKRQQQAMNALLNKAHTLYVGHKVDVTTVHDVLSRMGIVGERQSDIVELWTLERETNSKDLTPAQVEAALYYSIIPQAEAQQLLEHMGYTPHDAWLALSVRMHKPLGGEPARDPLPGGN